MKVKELIAELQMYDPQIEVRTQFEVLGSLNILDVDEVNHVDSISENKMHPIVLLYVEHGGSFKNYKEAHDGNSND